MKSERKRIVWLVLLIGYTIFIYSNSLVPAAESSEQSVRVLLMAKELLNVMGLENGWLTEHIVRKTAHFAEYSVLGFLIYHSFSSKRGFLESVKAALPAVFFIPFVDETLQLFTEGRSGQISDVWLDMSGAAAGFLAAAFFVAICKNCKKAGTGGRDENQL